MTTVAPVWDYREDEDEDSLGRRVWLTVAVCTTCSAGDLNVVARNPDEQSEHENVSHVLCSCGCGYATTTPVEVLTTDGLLAYSNTDCAANHGALATPTLPCTYDRPCSPECVQWIKENA